MLIGKDRGNCVLRLMIKGFQLLRHLDDYDEDDDDNNGEDDDDETVFTVIND